MLCYNKAVLSGCRIMQITSGGETIMCWGAGRRLAAVGGALALLWALVWWAV